MSDRGTPMMGMKRNHQHHHHHHHQISSFNPACCLRPPPAALIIAADKSYSNNDPFMGCSPIFTSPSSQQHLTSRIVQRAHGHRGCHGSKTTDEGQLSPRVGCMGQIKRSTASCSSKKKLFQFRRMFSLSEKSSVMTMIMSPRGSAKVEDDCCGRGISIADTMDPPLPVLKERVVARDPDLCNLWKRRRGGDGLQGLEIAQLKLQQTQHLRIIFRGGENYLDAQG